jgi:hypothetical protein
MPGNFLIEMTMIVNDDRSSHKSRKWKCGRISSTGTPRPFIGSFTLMRFAVRHESRGCGSRMGHFTLRSAVVRNLKSKQFLTELQMTPEFGVR